MAQEASHLAGWTKTKFQSVLALFEQQAPCTPRAASTLHSIRPQPPAMSTSASVKCGAIARGCSYTAPGFLDNNVREQIPQPSSTMTPTCRSHRFFCHSAATALAHLQRPRDGTGSAQDSLLPGSLQQQVRSVRKLRYKLTMLMCLSRHAIATVTCCRTLGRQLPKHQRPIKQLFTRDYWYEARRFCTFNRRRENA